MSGELNLSTLLASMSPELIPDEYVFVTTKINDENKVSFPYLMEFHEKEGATFIVKKTIAEQSNFEFSYPCRLITLNIYSSLEAVGFLAEITRALASEKISVNAVSAFYHDHIFVPTEKAERALEILQSFSK